MDFFHLCAQQHFSLRKGCVFFICSPWMSLDIHGMLPLQPEMLNADNSRTHLAARSHHLLSHSASKEKLRTRGASSRSFSRCYHVGAQQTTAGVGRIDTAFPISPVSGYVEDEEVSLSAREGRSPYACVVHSLSLSYLPYHGPGDLRI